MVALDCESRNAALSSLSSIYGIPEWKIEEFLCETDLERRYMEGNPQHPVNQELTRMFEQTLRCTPYPVDKVFWFHLSRTRRDADFASGILPLNEALPGIWEIILSIFKDTAYEEPLKKLRDNGVPNFQYNLKVGDLLYAGPYAMLVRESAFRSQEMGNHDYLWLPEIVEDICNGYHSANGVMIRDTVYAALIPYVVKFWSCKRIDKRCVESAMYYLYCTAHGQELSLQANTCFDGENCTIPQGQIVKIEKGDGLLAVRE